MTLPVFNIAITLKEKRQSFFHNPLKSLLSIKLLQRSKRKISQVNHLRLQYRLVLLRFKSIHSNMHFHAKELFAYTMVVYRSSSGQHCGVTGKKLWFAAV